MTIPVIVIVICRNVREKKSISIKCKSTLSRHTSLMHFDSDIEGVLQSNDGDPKVSVADGSVVIEFS